MDFSTESQDILRELGSIGSGNAITALSQIIGSKIQMKVPRCDRVSFDQLTDGFGGPESVVVSVLVQMSGGLEGFVMMVQSLPDALGMIQMLTGQAIPKESLTDIDACKAALAPLEEIGNILIGAYLRALSSMTALEITPSVPLLGMDMAKAIMDVPSMIFGEVGESALVLETEFLCEAGRINGHCFLIPTAESYETLMRLLKV